MSSSSDHDHVDKKDEQDQTNFMNELTAALFRAAPKSLRNLFRTIPRKINTHRRLFVKGIDQLNTVMDLGKEVTKVTTVIDETANRNNSTNSRFNRLKKKIVTLPRNILYSIPGFTKSTVIGTALFSTYDEMQSVMHTAFSSSSSSSSSFSSLSDNDLSTGNITSYFQRSVISGGIAGATNGALFHLWYYLPLPTPRPNYTFLFFNLLKN